MPREAPVTNATFPASVSLMSSIASTMGSISKKSIPSDDEHGQFDHGCGAERLLPEVGADHAFGWRSTPNEFWEQASRAESVIVIGLTVNFNEVILLVGCLDSHAEVVDGQNAERKNCREKQG
jgi:hypothetical protein